MTDQQPQQPGHHVASGHGHTTTVVPSDAQRAASENTRPQEKKKTSALREIIETALLALLIFVLVRTLVLNFKVDGRSMAPTFQNGEMLLVNRNAYRSLDAWDFVDWIPGVDERNATPIVDWGAPERGDVVVFTPPEPGQQKPYIKRVIGLPGDEVEIRDNGVYVNGTRLEEEYIDGKDTVCPGTWQNCGPGPVTVPEGSVYVMGDNRVNSEDSRFFGPVSEDRIIGKAWVVYWPDEAWGVVDHEEYPELQP